jgi:hypothetical protein
VAIFDKIESWFDVKGEVEMIPQQFFPNVEPKVDNMDLLDTQRSVDIHILCGQKIGRSKIVKKFDQDYNIRTCEKCGRALGMKLQYVECHNYIYVTCNECGYIYRMEPKKP